MIKNIEKTIREYLPNVIHMSLASCANNRPWICEVHYVYDSDLNIYFRSTAQRRHSEEIAVNNRVAGNIVEQHQIGQKPRGVYFEGTAELLETVTDRSPAYTLYCERFSTNESILTQAKELTGHKFYKITVEDYYLFDSRDSNPSTKYHLPWKRSGI